MHVTCIRYHIHCIYIPRIILYATTPDNHFGQSYVGSLALLHLSVIVAKLILGLLNIGSSIRMCSDLISIYI